MNGLNRFRYILIIIFAVLTAGTTAYLALFPDIGKGIAVFLGLVILLMSSALMNLCIAGTSDDTRRIALLVFSVGVMFLFLGGIAFILFSNSYGDEGPVETEIHDKQIDVIESPNINDNDAKENTEERIYHYAGKNIEIEITKDNNDSNDTTEENLSEKKYDTPAEKPAKKRGRPKAAEKSADTAEKPASKRGRPKKDKTE